MWRGAGRVRAARGGRAKLAVSVNNKMPEAIFSERIPLTEDHGFSFIK